MATSTCPKCTNTSFELKEITVRNAKYRYMAIQCDVCGAVISTKEYFNIGSLIIRFAKRLNIELE